MKKIPLIFGLFLLIFSCKKEVTLSFNEESIITNEQADISIIYPKTSGDKTVSNRINETIEAYISNQINFNDSIKTETFKATVEKFNADYTRFKNDFLDEDQKWIADIEGEIVLDTPELICFGMSSYMNTGGAHGNSRIDFLNFNPETGKLYAMTDLIDDFDGFSALAETHFKAEVKTDDTADYFFGKDFQLPESIGFNEAGVIILYNTYEIAAYSEGVTEFTIPYEDANSYLKINL
ncbi:DUF3298 domain-containing protein [Lacinutrix undariae]